VRRVVWIVLENEAYRDVIGSPEAPYITGLAGRCGLATSFFAETHPSLPNYIAMTAGATQGIIDGSGPSTHPLSAPSIFSQLGSGWRALVESMPSNCAAADTALYAVRHNPAVYYTGVRAACARQNVPLRTPLDLSARFTMIIPNLCNSMHWCPTSGDDRAKQLRAGDAFLATWLPRIVSTPEYASGGTVVFITWDEDSYGSEPIPTLVISPSTRPGTRVGTRFDHYALLRTTESLLGLPFLGKAALAPSMQSAFGL
jgi:phosphatidylinositol-3-phosphatase